MSTRKNRNSKGATNTRVVAPPKPRGKYALVLYVESKDLGVVETDSLADGAEVGGEYPAPDPVDWEPQTRSRDKVPAKIVAFGRKSIKKSYLELHCTSTTRDVEYAGVYQFLQPAMMLLFSP